jgi:RecB family exonuclease
MKALAPPRKRKPWKYCSASQVETFRKCARRWYWNKILRYPDPKHPSALLGQRIHRSGELYLKQKPVPVLKEKDEELLAQTLISVLPAPDTRYLIEYQIEMPTYEGGPTFTGYIDFLDPDRVNANDEDEPLIQDQKTRSDFRYAKKPQELLVDPQMVSYAKWAFRVGKHLKTVLVRHLYLRTKAAGRGKKRHFPTMVVEEIADRASIAAEWQKVLADISTMQAWAESGHDSAKALPPTLTSCGAYGGCPFRELCWGKQGPPDERDEGFDPSRIKKLGDRFRLPVIETTATTQEEQMPTLAEKLAANKKNGTTAPPPAAAKPASKPAAAAPAAKPAVAKPSGLAAKLAANKTLNPPDAPANAKNTAKPPKTVQKAEEEEQVEEEQVEETEEEQVEEQVEEEAPAPRRGTLGKRSNAAAELAQELEEQPEEEQVEEQPEEEPPARPAARASATASKKKPTPEPDKGFGTSPSFTLYIGCLPAKGARATLIEDLFAPVAQQIAEDHKVADYRLIDMGKWKGPAAVGLKFVLENYDFEAEPLHLAITTLGGLSDIAIDVLTPFADVVIRRA